jgi:hypothetical protein
LLHWNLPKSQRYDHRDKRRVVNVFRQPAPLSTGECLPPLLPTDGVWESGSRRWLVERRRIGVIRALEVATDPLFCRAGLVPE